MKLLTSLLFASFALRSLAVAPAYTEALNTFEAIYNNKMVSVKWVIEHPDNSGGTFTVERSRDGKHFEKISEIKASVNAYGEIQFIETDAWPLKKKSYYRLKYTDAAGNPTYSRMVFVEKSNAKPKLKVSVAKDTQGIEFLRFKKNEQVLLVIRDKSGNEFYSKSIFLGKDQQLILGNEMNLPSGQYLIVASSQSGLYSSTFTID